MRVTPAGRINLRHTLSRRVRGVTSAMFLALAVAAALTLTGCGHQSGLAGAPATNPAEPASLKIEPAPGARDVDPVAPVAVSAQTGTLTDVAMVNDAGKPVQGVLTPDAKFWHPVVPLGYGRTYTLTVTSRGPGGKTATQPVSFSTLTPPIRHQIAVLFEGALASATSLNDTSPLLHARSAAEVLIEADRA